MAEAANARLPRVAWLTRGMARSVVDDDCIAAVVDWLLSLRIAQKRCKQVQSNK